MWEIYFFLDHRVSWGKEKARWESKLNPFLGKVVLALTETRLDSPTIGCYAMSLVCYFCWVPEVIAMPIVGGHAPYLE